MYHQDFFECDLEEDFISEGSESHLEVRASTLHKNMENSALKNKGRTTKRDTKLNSDKIKLKPLSVCEHDLDDNSSISRASDNLTPKSAEVERKKPRKLRCLKKEISLLLRSMVADKKDVSILPNLRKHKTRQPTPQEQMSIKDIGNLFVTMDQIEVAEVSKF